MTRARRLRHRLVVLRATGVWRLLSPIRSFLVRHKRFARRVQPLLHRVHRRVHRLVDLVQGGSAGRYLAWIAAYDELGDHDFRAMREEQARYPEPPLLSLVVFSGESSEAVSGAFAESVLAQVWERWELRVVGGPAAHDARSPSTTRLIGDPRYRPSDERSETLVDAWNDAVRASAGEFVVHLDPRVSLRPHTLFLLARTIERHPDATLLYADEDEIDEDGTRSNHWFKPDWNEALFRSQNYLGGVVAFRRSVALDAGLCRSEPDGNSMWGLFLRMTAGASPETIHHLPFVLSHRRAGEFGPSPLDEMQRKGVAWAHEARLALVGVEAKVEPVGESSYRTRYVLSTTPPAVSILIPTTCNPEVVRPCLEGVLHRTAYADFEALLVVNEKQRSLPDRRDYLDALAPEPRARVLYHEDRAFNFSWANNWAVGQARGELVCFLNDDTTVIGSDWLAAMVAQVRDRVAAVGAMLFYPDDTIQHAGVVLGAGGLAAHLFKDTPRGIPGYHDRAVVDQDVSCITAACMLIRRDVFRSVGGFDEALATAFNDVDLCLRLREAGWRIVWTPSAELYHRESSSIGRHDVGEREAQWILDWDLIQGRWGPKLQADPHYSPNLSLDALQLWEIGFPPRVTYPWRNSPGGRRRDADMIASAADRPELG